MSDLSPVQPNRIVRTVLIIVGVFVLIVGLAAAIFIFNGITNISNYCNEKPISLSDQKQEIINKIDAIPLELSQKNVDVGGGCLAVPSVSYDFIVTGDYTSPISAKDDIVKGLREVGIPTPEDDQEPASISSGHDGAFGYDTPIGYIQLSYSINSHYKLELMFRMDDPIHCEVESGNRIICDGDDKDVKINKILADYPVSEIKVTGAVWHQ